MKQSSLLRWNHNGTSGSASKSSSSSSSSSNHHKSNEPSNHQNGKHNWIHQPDALKYGHVVYLVKFLGTTEVDQPKGIEVVKEGIRKMKFSQHLKRAEGTKTPKVELTISVDGVAVQEPKSKRIMYQYPLHRISYCADDKSEKKFFSFIAKEPGAELQNCFVFMSDKLSEEITLTIGQAFDLAYRRFLDTSGRELEMKQMMLLQRRVQELETENGDLKERLKRFECLNSNGHLMDMDHPMVDHQVQSNNHHPIVGTKLENLFLDEHESDFNPRSADTTTNGARQLPAVPLNGNNNGNNNGLDVFGCEPFQAPPANLSNGNSATTKPKEDPFGMGKFEAKDLESAIGDIDKKLAEMRDGFSRGLSFGHGNHDFSLDTLDPLKQPNNH